jgi:ubiquinone/menaquinone biosynthesis C-methylase UbiE
MILLKNNIPFDDKNFELITILDVIEHIYDQDKVLQEFNRILEVNGILIITAPKKHFLSFLDLGNLKFIFPKIHKIYYIITHSKNEYEYRYLNNPSGLIGDIEKEKSWHQHFSENEMESLLSKNGFKVEVFDGSCLLSRIFGVLSIAKLGFLIPNKIREMDCKLFQSTNLFCKAIKVKDLV